MAQAMDRCSDLSSRASVADAHVSIKRQANLNISLWLFYKALEPEPKLDFPIT